MKEHNLQRKRKSGARGKASRRASEAWTPHLIAAAPELYEALKDACQFMETAYRHSISPDLFDSLAEYEASVGEHVTIKKARAALAKARGEA